MELLENADKYGLTHISCSKIFMVEKPLQLTIDEKIYLLEYPDYVQDINKNLYKLLIEEFRNGNQLFLRLYKQMIISKPIFQFEKYCGKNIDLSYLEKETSNFKNIVYNPNNNDKFIAIVDIEKHFIHIYEFISQSDDYKAKYIHAEYMDNKIVHLDYSINQYTREEYKSIINCPHDIEKSDSHKKIWRLDGKISIEKFYSIILCMFDKNENYIKELFMQKE